MSVDERPASAWSNRPLEDPPDTGWTDTPASRLKVSNRELASLVLVLVGLLWVSLGAWAFDPRAGMAAVGLSLTVLGVLLGL